jgi:hypothetical protein
MEDRNVALALGGGVLCATPAVARKPPPRWTPGASAPARPVTLEQAVKQVQRQTHGHILATDTVTRGKTNVYRIKVLTPQGRVRVVQMHSNARTQSDPGRSGSDKSDSDQGGH